MYQFMSFTGPLLEGLFHCTVFFTQNGTLVIKFDQLIFAILLYIHGMNKRLATNSPGSLFESSNLADQRGKVETKLSCSQWFTKISLESVM